MCQQLSEADREVLEEEGVSLPRKWGKKRKRRRGESKREGGKGEDGERYREDVISERDKEWREVRQYMDPNPQLKGVDPGRHAPKVETTQCLTRDPLMMGYSSSLHRVNWRRRWMTSLREESLSKQLRGVRD